MNRIGQTKKKEEEEEEERIFFIRWKLTLK